MSIKKINIVAGTQTTAKLLLPASTISELQKRIALYEDMKAYKELYYRLFDGLYRFCFSFVKSKEPAEEIVSDVFIKVWQMQA